MASVQRRTRNGVTRFRAMWLEGNRLRSKTFAKSSEAKAFAAKVEQEIERQGVADIERHTVGRYLARWLATLGKRERYSPATLQRYERRVELAKRVIGDLKLGALTPAHLDHAYGELRSAGGRTRGGRPRPLTARSVGDVHRCLHVAFRQAVKWKLIPSNPATDATPPSAGKSKARAFTSDEVRRLLAAAGDDEQTYAEVATLMACGLRRSELLALAFDAIDVELGLLTVKRTAIEVAHRPVMRETAKSRTSLRTLSIPPELVELLRVRRKAVQEDMLAWGREYQREPLLVFPGLAGRLQTPQNLTTRLKALMRRADVAGVQPCHGWRHFAATSLLDGGQSIPTVQRRLGHASPTITMGIYAHAVAERDVEAAAHFGRLLEGNKPRT